MKIVGATDLASSRYKQTLRTRLRNLNLFLRYPRSYLRFFEVCGR